MMNEQVVKRMKEMKFYGMLRAFETSLESDTMNALTKDEMIAHLVEEEWDDLNERRPRPLRTRRVQPQLQ